MPSIGFESKISRATGFTTAAVQNELMMLNVEQGNYYSLDPIAAEIWKMLEMPMQVEEIIEQLLKRYDVSPDQCRADVLAFLGEMQGNGMIIIS